jgi:hypothetical protein
MQDQATTLAARRDRALDAARYTLDPVERLAALTAADRLDADAIESEYAAALSDLLEASR